MTTKVRTSPYAAIFSLPGAKAFSAAAAVARLPVSMMSLGIVLALNHIYDNWTIAGAMSAAFILAVAVVTPLYARLFDRFGQAKVGRVALTLQVICMFAFAAGAFFRVPLPLLFVMAILTGLTQFAFGALVRTRWAWMLRGQQDDSLLNTAYAFESAVDEVVFVFGPILAAFFATSVHPVSQLVFPAFCSLIGGSVFFSLKTTQPPVVAPTAVTTNRAASPVGLDGNINETARNAHPRRSLFLRNVLQPQHLVRSALLYPGVILLVLVFVCFNMGFSCFDVSVTGMMKSIGLEHMVGIQLALFALGSMFGALIFGSVKLKGSHWSHLIILLTVLSLWYVGFSLTADNLVVLGILEVLAGLFVSPVFATGNLLVKSIVPAESLTEGLSWLSTASSIGVSLGSSLTGVVLDSMGFHAGLTLPFITAACAVPLSMICWISARKRR